MTSIHDFARKYECTRVNQKQVLVRSPFSAMDALNGPTIPGPHFTLFSWQVFYRKILRYFEDYSLENWCITHLRHDIHYWTTTDDTTSSHSAILVIRLHSFKFDTLPTTWNFLTRTTLISSLEWMHMRFIPG